MPPKARPRYQNTKPTSMLNTETYAKAIQAGTVTADQFNGAVRIVMTAMIGMAKSRAQEITCQPPRRRDRVAPSA